MLEECLNHLGTRIEQFRVVANVERSPGAHANHGQLFVSARKGLLAHPARVGKKRCGWEHHGCERGTDERKALSARDGVFDEHRPRGEYEQQVGEKADPGIGFWSGQ